MSTGGSGPGPDELDALLSAEGWAYASATPVEAGDPGRYHALFGRDSLITALQVLPERPAVATATLRALAARQGVRDDPEVDEEPGKILHEFRPEPPDNLVRAGWPIRDGQMLYYGSADSTSWFLVLLAATGNAGLQTELAGAAAAAGGWLERSLERGDGLVRHLSRSWAGGLSQQGWRDTHSPATDPAGGGILLPDGSDPGERLADADTQAVAVAALRALTRLQPDRAAHWTARLEATRNRVSAAFTPETMAIAADGSSVPGPGSQLGWLLWADALVPDAAQAAAGRLIEPDIRTSYGLRTLTASSPVFRIDGYHRGAIWPFDCWFGWGGLRAAGHPDEAEQVRAGVLAALARLGRAPELYDVTAEGELQADPRSNRVQAWTVGAARALRSGWDGRWWA